MDNIDLDAVFFYEEFLILQHLKPGDSLVPYLKECLGRKICEESEQEKKSTDAESSDDTK